MITREHLGSFTTAGLTTDNNNLMISYRPHYVLYSTAVQRQLIRQSILHSYILSVKVHCFTTRRHNTIYSVYNTGQ